MSKTINRLDLLEIEQLDNGNNKVIGMFNVSTIQCFALCMEDEMERVQRK